MLRWFRKKPKQVEKQAQDIYVHCLDMAKNQFQERFQTPSRTEADRWHRFEGIAIPVCVALWRLKQNQSLDLAQAVHDAMFRDFELALREGGVADLKVGKHVRQLASAFHGRLQSYGAALDADKSADLSAALVRNQACAPEEAKAAAKWMITLAKNGQFPHISH